MKSTLIPAKLFFSRGCFFSRLTTFVSQLDLSRSCCCLRIGRTILFAQSHWIIQSNKNILGLDIQMDQKFGMNIVEAFGQMQQNALQFGLGEAFSGLAKFLDFGRERTTFAIFILNINAAVFHPRIVISNDMFVLDQSRMSENFVHGNTLLMSISMDFISGDLKTWIKLDPFQSRFKSSAVIRQLIFQLFIMVRLWHRLKSRAISTPF